jgi:hypothetical protein
MTRRPFRAAGEPPGQTSGDGDTAGLSSIAPEAGGLISITVMVIGAVSRGAALRLSGARWTFYITYL